MRDIKIASRYAKSLLKMAVEENELEAIYQDMMLVNGVCASNHDFELLLKSPIVKSDKKRNIVDAVFANQLSKISDTFIALIIAKKREDILSDIAVAFLDAYKIHKNVMSATVTSAVPLSQAQKDTITMVLSSNDATESIALKEVVNPELIGGIILRVGDKQIDESIKRKLINLEMEFDDNPYIKEF